MVLLYALRVTVLDSVRVQSDLRDFIGIRARLQGQESNRTQGFTSCSTQATSRPRQEVDQKCTWRKQIDQVYEGLEVEQTTPVITAEGVQEGWCRRIQSTPPALKASFRVHGILDALEPKEGTSVVDKQDHMAGRYFSRRFQKKFFSFTFNTAKENLGSFKDQVMWVLIGFVKQGCKPGDGIRSLKMKVNESVDASRLGCKIVTEVNSLGTVYENKKLVKKLLASVPDKFVAIVASIEQFADLNTSLFQEAIGRLKAFEEE
ncbi:sulfonylurea receptor [Artemisia annua]|uniref:Sulfonylurea receptor n=1 Tax=Artemisia annua TaxID=35608 RepID=A0A2U1MR00_ARTAN|nr:sulfonylurea receptor [Artemisia annua]